MITVVCTRCSKRMTVDDGFAGGVCRCSGCGTIQTVPAEAAQMVGATSGKVIFEKPGRTGSNLDELGQIVSSSGLVGSGLVSNQRQIPPEPKNKVLKPAAIGGMFALLLATGVLIGLSLRGGSKTADEKPAQIITSHEVSSQADAKPSAPKKSESISPPTKKKSPKPSSKVQAGRSIDDIDLSTSKVVIFLFDRGEATRPFVKDLRESALNAVRKLGEGRKFQIMYWSARGDTPIAPQTPDVPSDAIIEEVRSELAEIPIPRSTDIDPALEIAIEGEPTDIVIASAKGWQLDEEFVSLVIETTRPRDIRVHTIAFSAGPESEALQQIASQTGGTFVVWK